MFPIEPSKAICNIKPDQDISNKNKKFLSKYKFDLEKIGCPVTDDKKRKYYYAKFKPTNIQYNHDGQLINIEFEWNGYKKNYFLK